MANAECKNHAYKLVGSDYSTLYHEDTFYYWCSICKNVKITAKPLPKTEAQMLMQAKQGRLW